jgi:hypothetical protein
LLHVNIIRTAASSPLRIGVIGRHCLATIGKDPRLPELAFAATTPKVRRWVSLAAGAARWAS